MENNILQTLTERDNHQHLRHPFSVPEGATCIDIDFEYTPKRAGRYTNLLTLSLFDPLKERGTGHRGQPTQHVSLSASDATPGYQKGELLPGEWVLMVNTNLINPGSTVDYKITIQIGFSDQPAISEDWTPATTKPRGPGWYRGDLHGHTFHSDGSWDVDGLIGFAQANQLDFVTLTDHNTVSALKQMSSSATDDLLTMGGFELTTFYGHALALGIRDLIDWRVEAGKRSMSDIMQEIEAKKGLFAIAHPMAPGDPVCTGCHWDYADMLPGAAQVVEVWNEHWDSISNNEGAVQLWYTWLNEGHKIYATAGTDIHGQPKPEIEFGFNVVYTDALTESAILDGIRQGHLYVSSGPELQFTGQSSFGQTGIVGDTLNGARCEINLRWSKCREGDQVCLIVDGNQEDEFTAEPTGEKSWQLNRRNWCVVEIRDEHNHVRALTNPIFMKP